MNKFSRDEWLVAGWGLATGFLLCLILVGGWPGPAADEAEYYGGNYPTEGISAYHQVPKSWGEMRAALLERTEEDPVALYTLALTVFTGALGTATFFLWRDTRRLAAGAEETSERQLRAYVMIESANVEDFKIGQIPSPTVIVKNSGHTPARDVTVWVSAGFDTFPLSIPIPRRPQAALPPAPIAPGGTLTFGPTRLPQGPLPKANMDMLRAGTHAIYLLGEIRYTDAFGHKRETDFLLFTGGPIGAVTKMGAYSEGNRIT